MTPHRIEVVDRESYSRDLIVVDLDAGRMVPMRGVIDVDAAAGRLRRYVEDVAGRVLFEHGEPVVVIERGRYEVWRAGRPQ